MKKPTIAVISFPGNNCEVESMRAVREAGMTPVFFRWNDDRAKLQDVDGYFLVGGFSYEDRGRSGMVAGRDSLMDFIGRESEAGKVVIGNCNGAQILVESGLIPLGGDLQMSLARNAIAEGNGFHATGFLSEWIWMTPTCDKDRCATSAWEGAMHLPIAHGEGRFTTKDKDLIAELRQNNQIAFSYCDEKGKVSVDPMITPNGSHYAIAGICNAQGNVIAIMPHPERTPHGAAYFSSLKNWIESGKKTASIPVTKHATPHNVPKRKGDGLEIFIESIIVNNEERTVEAVARKYAPHLQLKQYRYFSLSHQNPRAVLDDLTLFNANKERAVIRQNGKLMGWDASRKEATQLAEQKAEQFSQGTLYLRRDEPDTGATSLGEGSMTGVCYAVGGQLDEQALSQSLLLTVFYNPHASTLELLS